MIIAFTITVPPHQHRESEARGTVTFTIDGAVHTRGWSLPCDGDRFDDAELLPDSSDPLVWFAPLYALTPPIDADGYVEARMSQGGVTTAVEGGLLLPDVSYQEVAQGVRARVVGMHRQAVAAAEAAYTAAWGHGGSSAAA